MRHLNVLMAVLLPSLMLSCNSSSENGTVHYAPLKNPTRVTVEQVPFTSHALLSWQDNCDNEASYAVFVKSGNSEAKQIASLPSDSQSFEITEGLAQGVTYSIGVQAVSAGPMLSSQVVYKEIAMFDYSVLPTPSFSSDPVYTPTSVAFEYSFKSSETYPVSDWGLCWAEDHTPTIEDNFQHGPRANKLKLVQGITCADLSYGKTYKVRAYVTCSKGTTYSDAVEVSLKDEPAAITFTWTEMKEIKVSEEEIKYLPEDIKLYKTTDVLNGRPINAWYAIADVTKGNVEFRMEFSSEAKTLENFYSEDNYVMTNAGYFSMATGVTGDYHVDAGVVSPSTSLPPLRGTFGVDKEQNAKAFWAARDEDNKTYFYSSPMVNIEGKNSYEGVSASYPSASFEWTPYYAMSAGPLLLKDGKVMTDATVENKVLVRNYEIIASDIFTNTTTPDRTAVGYTEDGKIILFVCDGRITESKGAGIVELAQIMKGLGCVGAVNFDGGGSTAMTVFGKRQNSELSNTSGGTENRPVGSVMGFYRKN